MKKILISAIMMMSLAACGGSKTADVPSNNQGATASKVVSAKTILDRMATAKYKDGEVLVKFKSGAASTTLMKTHDGMGATLLKKYDIVPNLQHVKLAKGMTVAQAVEAYMSDPNVEYAEPNYVRCAANFTPTAINPNDTMFTPQQWALYNTGTYANGNPGMDIKARDAWNLTQGSRNVVIAVLDSGIDYNHPDLVNNIWTNSGETAVLDDRTDTIDNDLNGYRDDWRGWNFVDNNNDPFDDLGHGTHVSGIIAGAGNNKMGISGVMWYARIMPLKIFNANSEIDYLCSTATGFVSDEIAAIEYAWRNGAKIINGSFHTGLNYCVSEYNAIATAGAHGVLFVAAAGNSTHNVDLDMDTPAIYDLNNVITVAATDQNDNLATFSNFGPQSVHIAAPGVYILSTIPTQQPSAWGVFGYDFYDGTSMASPHVAGVAGLIYSYYGTGWFNHQQVRGMLLRYVDKTVDNPNLFGLENRIWSNGRLNAYKAVSSLLHPTGFTAVATGTTQITLNWTDLATGEDVYVIERKINGVFTKVGETAANTTSYTDTGLTPGVTYEYRINATAYLPNPPGASLISASSFYSSTASAATPLTGDAVAGSSGGGGCSVGARKNVQTAAADSLVMLLPLMAIGIIRTIRRRK